MERENSRHVTLIFIIKNTSIHLIRSTCEAMNDHLNYCQLSNGKGYSIVPALLCGFSQDRELKEVSILSDDKHQQLRTCRFLNHRNVSTRPNDERRA